MSDHDLPQHEDTVGPVPIGPPDVAPVSDVGSQLLAWQDRCAIVEKALAAANETLNLELTKWQSRCGTVEAALAEANARLERDLSAWESRCAVTEAALTVATDRLKAELPEWERRCAETEAALTAATDRLQRELPEWGRRCTVSELALAEATDRLGEEIPRWRDRCELAESALASMYDRHQRRFTSFPEARTFLAFASHFSPARAIGADKRRIGSPADGGYVMIDDVACPSLALSLGIGDDTSWDREMADLGAIVHQYDHTVEAPPGQASSIVFHPKQIVDVADGIGVTLGDALSVLERGHDGHPSILKIDIEGSEWSVLDAAPDDVLQRFDQIVCEYHGFEKAIDPSWFECASRVMERLSRYFQVVHVHGNNYGPIVTINGVPFPSVLEVTHANRNRYRFCNTEETFPTEIDSPNNSEWPDLWLGSFAFERVR